MKDKWGLFDKEKKPDNEEIYSVSRLNKEARNLLEDNFRAIWVEGEVSNLHVSSAKHLYFTLKEEDAEIDAVMFAGDKASIDFEPEDGMALLVKATLTVYERRGRYQLRVRDLREVGEGKLQKKFQQLKDRLKEEGLFDQSHKKKIPEFPCSIGIITSPGGAAVRDIVSTIRERFPAVNCYIFPVKVQGEEAAGQITEAIRRANKIKSSLDLEALIVSRGGGSLEDLWPFNEEVVARAIYNSNLPVISGVGHEVDFTISDFVADLRVPTPTAAGKEIVPDSEEINRRVEQNLNRLKELELSRLREYRNEVKRLANSFGFRIPIRTLEDRIQESDELVQELINAGVDLLAERSDSIESLIERLSLADPTRLLEKGYSVTYGENGEVVRNSEAVKDGENLKTVLYKGIIRSVVTEVEQGE
ncbi:exodeoxyribonuclease VII large subunit [Candidatus Bipolaricaulota bacterium]|nr:exodeoxyribonuclease VII large subunit [Candidatus Bipolaricaulota bacterium]